MNPNQLGLLGFLACIAVAVVGAIGVIKLQGRDHWYEQGFQDCKRLYKYFEVTEEDGIVLRHLRAALLSYIKVKGYQRKGDVKKISQIDDFEKLKQVTWEICERKNNVQNR